MGRIFWWRVRSVCTMAWSEMQHCGSSVAGHRAPAASPVCVSQQKPGRHTELLDGSLLCSAQAARLAQSILGVTGRSRGANCSKSSSVCRGEKLFLPQISLPVVGHEHLLSKWTPAEFTDVSRLWIPFMHLMSRNLISRHTSVQTTQILQGEMP